jgi:hypothetical protein
MKRGHLFQRIVLIFFLVLIGYLAGFKWIEHRRAIKGPWAVTFTTGSGAPVLIVNQTKLEIRGVRIVFVDERVTTNLTQTLEFSQARPVPFNLPFGKCVFLDLLFLPGTVALQVFGHEIQFLPRMLTIDKVERPWCDEETIELRTTSTPK